ncbi:MAG: ketoacyl-ACP synthase III [Bacteroidetes bacterium]|nr:MAG: ketoacyl-ACP synthase III [Bacteroidota bacterium]
MSRYSVIKATGCYIPEVVVKNEDFLTNKFFEKDGTLVNKPNEEIIKKFEDITTIQERRYAPDNLLTSDIATLAAENALRSSKIDPETLDYIIVAHNFGDVRADNKQVDIVPALAARVKYNLKIQNPYCVAYDVIFGCPGWLQGVIQADYYIRSGQAEKVMVIGAEILSRVTDPHDRDTMLYADGAGAVILEAVESEEPVGIIKHKTRSDTYQYSKMLLMDKSYNPEAATLTDFFLKMNGRRLYQYALSNVPDAVKSCMDEAGVSITEVKKFLIHQANGKMDDAILQRIYKLYNITDIPENIMPMTVQKYGNSSVATLPTLLDLILKKQLPPHEIRKGDLVVLASVGAGMNINAVIYKF